MLALIRRDPIRESLPRWILISALSASVMEGLRTFSLTATRTGLRSLDPDLQQTMTACILWVPLILFLALGNTGWRCRMFDLALPLTARRLWLAHLMAVLLGGLILLSTAVGVIGLHRLLLSTLPGRIPANLGLLGLYTPAAAVMILAAVLTQSFQPAQYRIRLSRIGRCLFFLLLISAWGLILVLRQLHPAICCVPVLLAVWAGLRTYRSLPAGFRLVPLDADVVRETHRAVHRENRVGVLPGIKQNGSAEGRVGRGWAFRWFLLRTVLRTLAKKPAAWFMPYPFLIFFGLLISGYLTGLSGHRDDYEYAFLLLAVFMLFNFLLVPLSSLHYVDALPLSRRFLCGLILLPGLGFFFLSYGAGKIGLASLDESNPLVFFQQADAGLHLPPYPSKVPVLRVPAEYGRIAWDGRVPDNRAPWGESHTAWQEPLYQGGRFIVYSPFSTEKGSSNRFVAWQLSRALYAVHGVNIPPERIQDYCLVDSGQSTILRGKELNLAEEFPELRRPRPMRVFAVYPLLITGLWLLLVALFLQSLRAGVSEAKIKQVFYVLQTFCFVLIMGQMTMMISGFARPTAASGFLKILQRQLAEVLPGGEAAVWGLALLLCAGFYRFVQGRFERIEVPLPKSKS